MNKKGFTVIEVSILLVIFLIVAVLVIPLALDDTLQAKNIAKWKSVQADFLTVSSPLQMNNDDIKMKNITDMFLAKNIKGSQKVYKIKYLNNKRPDVKYEFGDFKTTNSNATIAVKYEENPENSLVGFIMYDVNGAKGPNVWGRDVFGLNMYDDHFEPFCKRDVVTLQKLDCSNGGTGLCCSNYYLIGGQF